MKLNLLKTNKTYVPNKLNLDQVFLRQMKLNLHLVKLNLHQIRTQNAQN